MYKCENCRVQRDIGDDVYLVESAFMEIFLPTCSKKCSEIIKKEKLIKYKPYLIELRIQKLKKNVGNEKFQIRRRR